MTMLSSVAEIDATIANDPRWALIQRVVSSQHFRTSARLREFLLYVGECALRDSPKDVTEQQIGVHVFQRPHGYNSSDDSIVRTHARLLRKKLGEYFSGEGAHEKIVIEIPKGHYLPIFQAARPCPLEVLQTDAETCHVAVAPIEPQLTHGGRGKLWVIYAGSSMVVLLAAIIWWGRSKPWPVKSGMEVVWQPFLSGTPPLVIYSDGVYVEGSEHGLQIAPAEAGTAANQPHQANDNNQLTGTGAVVAVSQLTKFFDAHHATFILKRSHLATWDDARATNLIFIGSKASNSALNMLPSMSDFALLAKPDSAGFINLHPKPGEPSVYSRPLHSYTKDYAVVALLPGLQQGKSILVFSGLSTLATEAAVEYACRPEDVADLLRAIPLEKGNIRPFEALLETVIVGGVPMEAKLVTIRAH